MIFVVSGLPRSGTSMMMQILQAGGLEVLADEVRQADDSNPRGYFEYEPVKSLARGGDWIDAAEGKVVKVIAQLIEHLPLDHAYAILFMKRDLNEIMASQATMLERLGRKGAADQEAMKAIFERRLNVAIAFAESRPKVQALVLDYTGILREPLASIESIREFLGIELDVEKAAAVVDPTLYRERSG